MAHITLTITEEDDEWMVKYYEDGTYVEGSTYYTDDIDDAMGTAKAMEDEAQGQGHTVNVEFDEELAGDYLSNPEYLSLKCDSCEALAVNGVATHELGCPDSWINPATQHPYAVECAWCGSDFTIEYSFCTAMIGSREESRFASPASSLISHPV